MLLLLLQSANASADLAYSNAGAGANTYALTTETALVYANVGNGITAYAATFLATVPYANAGLATNAYGLALETALQYTNAAAGSSTYFLGEPAAQKPAGGGFRMPFELAYRYRYGLSDEDEPGEVEQDDDSSFDDPAPPAVQLIVEPQREQITRLVTALRDASQDEVRAELNLQIAALQVEIETAMRRRTEEEQLLVLLLAAAHTRQRRNRLFR